jgi:hypothetical protein
VTLTPFGEFEIDFYYPDDEKYKFEDGKFVILRDGKVVTERAVEAEDYSGLRSTLMLTNFFLYYISDPEKYKLYRETEDTVIYKYQPNSKHKELLYIDRKANAPGKITTDFLRASIKIKFDDFEEIEGLGIPMRILTTVSSNEEFAKNIKEEMIISEIKVKKVNTDSNQNQ